METYTVSIDVPVEHMRNLFGEFDSHIKKIEKQLRFDKTLNENRLFEKELKGLIKNAPYQYFLLKNGIPSLGKEIFDLEDINDKTVFDLIYTLSQTRYIKEEELTSLIWQSKLYIILAAAEDRENPRLYLDKMYKVNDLDENALEELSPLHRAFSFDEVYKSSSRETRSMYRSKAALISRLTEIDESQYTGELTKRAILDDLHVGEVIEEDYRNIYPYANTALYISVQLSVALVLSLAAGLFTRLWTVPITFFPVLGAVKSVNDLILSRFSHAHPLPRIKIKSELPENGYTLCAMSALISDTESLRDALSKLKTAKLKNPQKGIFFCLLCDLSPAAEETKKEDGELFSVGEALRLEIFPECSVIFRKRVYSKTMRKYQGFDRKRGAVEELTKYLCGEGEEFYRVLGDISKLPECEFEGQTKGKLGNPEVGPVVYKIVSEKLTYYFEEHPDTAQAIVVKAINGQAARDAAKKAMEAKRKSVADGAGLPGKLADCYDKDIEKTEIYIVEGDSAGGSAKQGRNSRYQAILPLWGKMLNVEKARVDKVYNNEKLVPVVKALGTGIGDDFDISKLRYGRVVIMADADVDGAHIRTLLLTFFFRFMRPLVEEGHVYLAQPPLFKVSRGKQVRYAYSDDERDDFIKELQGENSAKVDVQRYKGLGEMDPAQLWETTMNPDTRTMLQVTLDDAAKADLTFSILMGDKVEPRREFIETNAQYVQNLDI